MDHPCHDFLARSRRPENQHRDVRLRRRPDPFEDDQHLLVAADHLAEAQDGGRVILGADRRTPLEECVQQLRGRFLVRPPRDIPRGRSREALDHAKLDELAEAVVDVQPHSAKRRHQRVDVKGLVRLGAQKPKQPGAQGRLHQALKTGFLVSRRRIRTGRHGTARGSSRVVHGGLPVYRPSVPTTTACRAGSR